MARVHGKDCRVYIGVRDASGDIVSITPKASAVTHDTTTCGDDWVEHTAGLKSWELAFEAFYDPAAGEIGPQTEDVGASFVVTIVDGDANAIGDTGMVFPAGILESRDTPIAAADMVKVNGSIKGSGQAGLNAKLLHVLGEETITASTASLQNAAGSTANGGRANLHVTAVTGTWTIVVEESSADGGADPWAAKATFTQVTAATAESVAVTGTVEEYLRVTATENVAGSITFVVTFARY